MGAGDRPRGRTAADAGAPGRRRRRRWLRHRASWSSGSTPTSTFASATRWPHAKRSSRERTREQREPHRPHVRDPLPGPHRVDPSGRRSWTPIRRSAASGSCSPITRAPSTRPSSPPRESTPEDYIAQLTAPLTETAVGFKLPMSSIRANPDALELLEPEDLRVVRLSRLNLLALFVSRRLLASTRVPQSTRGDYGDATVVLDPKQCLSVFRRTEEHERYLDGIAAGKPVFRITYEELATGQRLDRDPELSGCRADRAALAVQPHTQPSPGGDGRELVGGRGRPSRLPLREVPRG